MVTTYLLVTAANGYTKQDGPLSASASQAAVCSGCHAMSSGQLVAALGELSVESLQQQMLALREADGQSAMHRLIKAYSDAEILSIAESLARGKASG